MILKGNQRSGAIDLATHLLNSFDNEKADVAHIKGTVARDLLGAFCEVEAIASGTRCKQPFYSLSINPPVPLTDEQYAYAIAQIEKVLGLAGQPRAIVFHTKKNRRHCHVVWSRIDFKAMKAIQLSHDRFKLKNIARQLGDKFGLELPPGLAGNAKAHPDLTLGERAQANETGIAPEQRRFDITEAFMASDNAASFTAALEAAGYILARGDKRGFVLVDGYGHIHSLSRQIDSVSAKNIRTKLDPLTPEDLPSASSVKPQRAPLDTGKLTALRDRLARKANQAHAKRRAQLYRDSKALENRQAEEQSALGGAQLEEANRTFPRLVSSVWRLFERYSVFRSVLSPIHRLTHLKMQDRHVLELEALRKRHNREWIELNRRDRLLKLLRKREEGALDQALHRALIEKQRHREAFTVNAADITTPRSLYQDNSGEEIDYELEALERYYSADYVPLTTVFNKAANLDPFDDDDSEGSNQIPQPDNPYDHER